MKGLFHQCIKKTCYSKYSFNTNSFLSPSACSMSWLYLVITVQINTQEALLWTTKLSIFEKLQEPWNLLWTSVVWAFLWTLKVHLVTLEPLKTHLNRSFAPSVSLLLRGNVQKKDSDCWEIHQEQWGRGWLQRPVHSYPRELQPPWGRTQPQKEGGGGQMKRRRNRMMEGVLGWKETEKEDIIWGRQDLMRVSEGQTDGEKGPFWQMRPISRQSFLCSVCVLTSTSRRWISENKGHR